MAAHRFISAIISFVIGLANLILSLRLILKLFAANAVTPFVQWVYATSNPLLAPFHGILPATSLGSGSVLEFSTLFAIAIYALIGYLIVEVIEHIESAVDTTHVHHHAI